MRRLLQARRAAGRGAGIGVDRFLDLMRVDKKAEGGEIRFVVIEELGRAAVRPAPDALVAAVIERATRAPH